MSANLSKMTTMNSQERLTVIISSGTVTALRVFAATNRRRLGSVVEEAVSVCLYLRENHPDDLAALLADIEAQSTESEAA